MYAGWCGPKAPFKDVNLGMQYKSIAVELTCARPLPVPLSVKAACTVGVQVDPFGRNRTWVPLALGHLETDISSG